MKIDNDDVDIFKSEFVGEYEGNRTIILKDNKPFLSTKNNSYPLVQINMQEFIIDGDDYFGKGNSRILFILGSLMMPFSLPILFKANPIVGGMTIVLTLIQIIALFYIYSEDGSEWYNSKSVQSD
jgi:hypothetical protein